MGIVKESKRQRMMRNVEKITESGCWIWMRTVNNGYGRCSPGFYGSGIAHRAFYEEFVGPVPAGMEVCHTCDVRSCVNPDHLYVGTRIQNCRDAVERKRYKNGQKTHCSKGHPYDEQNTRWVMNRGKHLCRACKACVLENKRKWRRLRRDLRNAGLIRPTGEVRDGQRVCKAVD